MCVQLLIAAIELVSPAGRTPVALIPQTQRVVLSKETLAERTDCLLSHQQDDVGVCGPWRKSTPVRFTWKSTAGEKGPWEVLIGKAPDLSDARQFLFNDDAEDPATGRISGAELGKDLHERTFPGLNLEIAARYYWKVTGNVTCGTFGHGRICVCKDRPPAVSSGIGSFVTEDLAPRWIEVEGRVGNFRDLGGRLGLKGRRVRQGLVYRSQGLNDNSVDGVTAGRNRLTVEDVRYLTEGLGIRTDLDLRTFCETAGLEGVSPLGPKVRLVVRPSRHYRGIFTPAGKEAMAENFREFLNRENYPILFHCIGGADRTGALAYVLNGVLGVRRQELETDWESTFYPKIPDWEHADDPDYWCRESHLTEGFLKYGTATSSWNERIVLYLKDCGITDDEIERFRKIMLET